MKKFLALLLFPVLAQAALTTGGVNWLDSSSTYTVGNFTYTYGYTKPQFYPITVPDEAGVANKYYVDLSNGSGATCSEGSPCRSLSAVSGKTGTTGGPAYIYVKGTGELGAPTLYGTAGNEVVIKPWNDSTLADFSGDRQDWNTNRVQYVIFDGGPNLRIKFTLISSDENASAVYLNNMTVGQHSHITFYRTLWEVVSEGNWNAIWGRPDNISWINSEFFTPPTAQQQAGHPMYHSGATAGAGGIGPISFINNIFRDSGGEAIEIRPYVTFSSYTITGNAFRNLGKGKCSAPWRCRSAITFGNSQDPRQGSITSVLVANNLIWDTGEGCIRPWQDNPTFIYNTCYNWGMGNPVNASYSRYAAAGYSSDGEGTYKNNIFYASTNTAAGQTKVPFDNSPFVKSNNVCRSGTTCGTSSYTYTDSPFLSLEPSSPDFLKPKVSFPGQGRAVDLGLTVDYFGNPRPDVGGAFDIGAGQILSDEVVPAARVSLISDDYDVELGGTFTLTYTPGDATTCTGTGGNVGIDGWASSKDPSAAPHDVVITAYKTAVYGIQCFSPGGDSQIVTVTVVVPPPAVSFSVNKQNVFEGQEVTVSWDASNGTCTASNGWSGNKTSGSPQTEVLVITETVTLELECASTAGTTIATPITIYADPLPPPLEITISPAVTNVVSGGSTTINYTVTGTAASCTGTNGSSTWAGTRPTTTEAFPTGALTADTVYTLSCLEEGGTGRITEVETIVYVYASPPVTPAPIVSLTATDYNVSAGEVVQLIWSSSYAETCTASRGWEGDKGINGYEFSPPLQTTQKFTLTCAGLGGETEVFILVVVSTPPVGKECKWLWGC